MVRRYHVVFALLLWGAAGLAEAKPPVFRAGEVVECAHQAPIDNGPPVPENVYGEPMMYEDGGCQSCGIEGCTECGGGCGLDGCWDSCGPARGFWGRAEYIHWWIRGMELPPLVTTSPNGTAQAQAGVLPGATILFGDERVNEEGRSGVRTTLGYWLDDCETRGIEVTVFGLEEEGTGFSAFSAGDPILARPFFNVDTQAQDAGLIAFPNIVAGSVGILTTSEVFGTEVNFRRAVHNDYCHRFDLIAGYRFFRFDEDLRITERTTALDPAGNIPLGTTLDIRDSFGTDNEFHGGQLGLLWQHNCDCWTVNLLTKLAIGGMNQNVVIDGSTTTTVPGTAPVTSTGGFLALDSNSGRFSRSQFSVIPEFGVSVDRQLTPCCRLSIGYTLMIVTNVVRPGEQISLNIDPDQFPPSTGGTQPAFTFNDSDLWLQGINIGLECVF